MDIKRSIIVQGFAQIIYFEILNIFVFQSRQACIPRTHYAGNEPFWYMAELVHDEKENSDWFPWRSEFAVGTAKTNETK